jgi:hypothetical protein
MTGHSLISPIRYRVAVIANTCWSHPNDLIIRLILKRRQSNDAEGVYFSFTAIKLRSLTQT